PELQANGSEEQGKRDCQRHDNCAAHITQKNKQDDDHQDHSLGEVMHHGVRRVVHQVVAVEIRDDLYAPWQDLLVQALHHGVDALESGGPVRSLAHKHDAFDDVIIVDNHAIGAMDGLPDLTQANFWALLHNCDVFYS